MPDLADTVILLGVLQAAVLAAVLAARRTDRLANRFLATLIGAVALMLLFGYLNARFAFRGYPHLLALGNPLPFLFGPLLYLYVAALTRPIARFDPRFLVHALPFVAHVIYMLQVFYLKTGAEKLALASEYLAGGGTLSFRLMNAFKVVQALAYVLASFLALRRYSHKIEGYFSDVARIDLRWLMTMVLAHAAVWGTVLVSNVIQAVGLGGALLQSFERAIQLGSVLVVFLTGYISLWQPELFQKARAAQVVEEPPPEAQAEVELPPPEPPPTESRALDEPEPLAEASAMAPEVTAPAQAGERPKYHRNRLDDQEAEEFARKLKALMEKEQAYRDAELTLPVLADALGTTPHVLSQVLNVRIGSSFYAFVNGYRAEALKAALADPQRHERGVLELALEVGFNSKSTLNSFFKRHTGLTPTQFRRRALHAEAE